MHTLFVGISSPIRLLSHRSSLLSRLLISSPRITLRFVVSGETKQNEPFQFGFDRNWGGPNPNFDLFYRFRPNSTHFSRNRAGLNRFGSFQGFLFLLLEQILCCLFDFFGCVFCLINICSSTLGARHLIST